MYFLGVTHIEHKSEAQTLVSNFKDPVTLYCLASCHTTCKYEWKHFCSSHSYPSTPVIYVDSPGIYECSVMLEIQVAATAVFEVKMKGTIQQSKSLTIYKLLTIFFRN